MLPRAIARTSPGKGFWGASCKATGLLGSAVGMGVAATVRYVLTDAQVHSFGWRLPFLLSIVFGIVGIILRSRLSKDTLDESADHVSKSISGIVASDWREIIAAILMTSLWSTGYITIVLWMGYYLTDTMMLAGAAPVANTWAILFAAHILLVFLFPLCGYIGDVLQTMTGPHEALNSAMLFGSLYMAVLAVPAFMMIATNITLCSRRQ